MFLRKTSCALLLAIAACLLAAPAAAQSRHNAETAKQLDIFNALYSDLDRYYVDTLSAKKNVENAVAYMLEQLDPYTEYYPEDAAADLHQMTTGKYAGIGALISARKDLDRCIISEPYEGQPAAEAGLRPGDVILAIDGRDVGLLSDTVAADYSSAVSAALRGEPGTTFELRVRRPTVKKELTFRLTRRAITLPSITCTTVLADSIGYILLNGYKEGTARDVRLALAELKKQGARRLVLDLRGNGGGLMGEAVNLVGLFVPRSREVVSTRGKLKENTATYRTTSAPLDTDIPIVVLTNYGTASAAEITSGALQDYDRAVIVGRRTYGKGLVQETHDLPGNAVLKLTTSRYYIPSGRCVQAYKFEDGEPVALPDSLSKTFHTAAGRPVHDGGGITPDVVVKADTLPNLLIYLSRSDALFDFCAEYRNTHPTIAAPEKFSLTDAEYADLRRYLREHGFTYDRRSLTLLGELRKVAAFEGYAAEAADALNALEAKLSHNEDFDFERWRPEITRLVERNLVQFYYYDSGASLYELRDDDDLREALSILRDDARYRSLLAAPAK